MDNYQNNNFWVNYNSNLIKLSKEMLLFNKNNIFNQLESNNYNHIRDIVALSILAQGNNKSKTKVLDYGSNSIPWSNMSNKLDLKKIDLTIFDPFDQKDSYSKIDFNFSIKIVNKLDMLKSRKFDLTIFGSSSQYINSFYENVLNNEYILSPRILFTHTPITIGSEFTLNQCSGFKGKQVIRSFNEITEKLRKKGYAIVFKSRIDNEYERVDNRFSDKIIYANLLFEKQKP